MLRRLLILFVPAIIGVPGVCQPVISGHSGLILFGEGSVLIDGAPLALNPGRFSELKEGSTLSTRNGRVEMLLTPAVLLRLGGNSAVRMIQNRLSDAQVAFLNGSAIVESTEVNPYNSAVTLMFQEWHIRLPEKGLYRIDSEPAQISVHTGRADVSNDENKMTVGDASLLSFTTGRISEQGVYQADALDRWSKERSKIDRIATAQKASDSAQNNGSKKMRVRMFPRARAPLPARTWFTRYSRTIRSSILGSGTSPGTNTLKLRD